MIAKDDIVIRKAILHIYLHSTMFLLILEEDKFKARINKFTFHNVSINSPFRISSAFLQAYLHSTMFLLIRT